MASEKALKYLDEPLPQPQFGEPPNPNPIWPVPLPTNQVRNVPEARTPGGQLTIEPTLSADEQYRRRNEQPGVPFNLNEELGFGLASAASLRQGDADKIAYLKSIFPPGSVRSDENGSPIIRVLNQQTGKPEDIPLNKPGFSPNDLANILGTFPQMAATLGGIKGGRSLLPLAPVKKARGFLRDAFFGALGGEAEGVAQQALTRAYDNMPIEMQKILAEHARNVPVNIGMDYLTAGAAKTARGTGRFLLSAVPGSGIPFPGISNPLLHYRGPIQTAAVNAQDWLVKKISSIGTPEALADAEKLRYLLNPAQKSGWPLISQLYEYLRRHPAGAGPITHAIEREDMAAGIVQKYMTQPLSNADDETVGKIIIKMLDDWKTAADQRLGAEVKSAEQSLQGQIKDKLHEASLPYPMNQSVLGEDLRTSITKLRDAEEAVQHEKRAHIATLPGGTGKLFNAEDIGLQQEAEEIYKRLPSPQMVVRQPVPSMMIATKYGDIVDKEFVPDHVLGALNKLRLNRNYSLDDLIQIRTTVYEDISAGQALPNTGTHYLNSIGRALTKAIKRGIDQMPPGPLKEAVEDANRHYIEKVLPFKEAGIDHIFVPKTEKGYLENVDLAELFLKHGDRYERILKLLGRNSAEHKMMKRAIVDQVLNAAKDDPHGAVINAERFIQTLRALKDNPQTEAVFSDVFGHEGDALFRTAGYLKMVRDLGADQFDRAQLQAILTAPRGSELFPFKKLADDFVKRREVYNNNVVRKLVSGEMDPKKIRADEFVNLFAEAADYTDLLLAWNKLATNPKLQEQIKRKTIEGIFVRAARYPDPSDVAQALDVNPTKVLASDALLRAMGDATQQRKLKLIIGDNGFEWLKKITSVQAAKDWSKMQAGQVGIFAAGGAVGAILRLKAERIGGAAKEFIIMKALAILMNNKAFHGLLGRSYTAAEIPWLMTAVITSQPFINAVIEDSEGNHNQAFEILRAAKRFAEDLVPGQPQPNAQPAAPAQAAAPVPASGPSQNALQFLDIPLPGPRP